MEKITDHINHTHFEKYFAGEMSSEEQTNFENALQKDPFAQEALEGFMLLQNNTERLELLQKTEQKLQEKAGFKTAKIFPLKTILSIAVSIILLIGVFWVVQNQFQPKDNTIAQNQTQKPTTTPVENIAVEEINSTDTTTTIASPEISTKEAVKPIEQTQNTVPKPPAVADVVAHDFYEEKELAQTQTEETEVPLDLNEEEEEIVEVATTPSSITTQKKQVADTPNNTNISLYRQGINQFNQGKFSEAIAFFEQSIEKQQNLIGATYYTGMAYFNTSQYNKAIAYFDKTINANQKYSTDAQWYKALALINKGKKNKAKVILNQLINSNSKYQRKAEEKLLLLF